MTPIELCDQQMALAWNGDGESAKAYLYTLWYTDWLLERDLLQGKTITPMNLNDYAKEVHAANSKWWVSLTTGERIDRNVGELLALVHSEVSEALEGHRKNLMDDKLPHRQMFEVELADTVIRILDICAGFGLDLEGAYREKMAYNAVRLDHKIEARLAQNGKKY